VKLVIQKRVCRIRWMLADHSQGQRLAQFHFPRVEPGFNAMHTTVQIAGTFRKAPGRGTLIVSERVRGME
jgi:hypothetical protein